MCGESIDVIAEIIMSSIDARLVGFCRRERRERAVSSWMEARRYKIRSCWSYPCKQPRELRSIFNRVISSLRSDPVIAVGLLSLHVYNGVQIPPQISVPAPYC
jgi:hypothetical protein